MMKKRKPSVVDARHTRYNCVLAGIFVAFFMLITLAGCAAWEELPELAGIEPTKPPAVDKNGLQQAGTDIQAIGEASPPGLSDWIVWAGGAVLGAGNVLAEKRRRAEKKRANDAEKDLGHAKEAIGNVKALRQANGGNADFNSNKAELKNNTSPQAQTIIEGIKANEALLRLLKSKRDS
jgi:hypothetical protein